MTDKNQPIIFTDNHQSISFNGNISTNQIRIAVIQNRIVFLLNS